MPRYTADDRAEWVQHYRDGKGYMTIAHTAGCSHNTVRAAVRAAGIKPRPAGAQRRLVTRYGTWRRSIASNGYPVWSSWDAERRQTKYLLEHRLMMAAMLGRELRPGENVHHRDGDRANNDPANLELWAVPHPAGQRVADRER